MMSFSHWSIDGGAFRRLGFGELLAGDLDLGRALFVVGLAGEEESSSERRAFVVFLLLAARGGGDAKSKECIISILWMAQKKKVCAFHQHTP